MCRLARSKFQYPDLQNTPAHLVVFIWKCNSSFAFWHIYKTAEEVGSLKKRPQTALDALLGASEKESRFPKVLRKPKRPPNDVGRRLEEETAESRFMQHLFTNIAIFDVGRPSKSRLTRHNRPFQLGAIAKTWKTKHFGSRVLHFRELSV